MLISIEEGTLDTTDRKISMEVKPLPDSKIRQVHHNMSL
jgi:hypothetical protein